MKALVGVLLLGLVAYLVWQRNPGGSAPEKLEDPVFGEMRVDLEVQGRELEMALFARIPGEDECRARANLEWAEIFEQCPACKLQPVQCRDELPPRYARLFDDVPIPSWYLSLAPGAPGEREGRLVVYGLSDQEGEVVCKQLRKAALQKYRGTAHCVAPSGD